MTDNEITDLVRSILDNLVDDMLGGGATVLYPDDVVQAGAVIIRSAMAAQRERDAAWIEDNVMPVKKARYLAAIIRTQSEL